MTRKLLILLFFLSTLFMESQSVEWKTNVTDAVILSSEQRKPMLILFTSAGAENRLETEVFKTPYFEKWSRNNVILVKLDLSDASFSKEIRDQNVMLKNAFGVENFPEVCFATASLRKGKTNFNSLGKVTYTSGGAKTWISDSNAILELQ